MPGQADDVWSQAKVQNGGLRRQERFDCQARFANVPNEFILGQAEPAFLLLALRHSVRQSPHDVFRR